jgi:hypothetical protein
MHKKMVFAKIHRILGSAAKGTYPLRTVASYLPVKQLITTAGNCRIKNIFVFCEN